MRWLTASVIPCRLPQASGLLRLRRLDEPDPSCKGRVEVEGGAKAVNVVETDAVGVTTNCPDQDDVSHEGASGVGLHRGVHGPYPPPIDR